jgi:8-oxo-dGTP pyrophosphatase MutT (NUDIX family)
MSSERGPGSRPGLGSGLGRRGGRQAQETSAGGVVIRGEPGHEQVVAIVPVKRAPGGERVLGLPKGHIDPGETELDAAVREVREEAGVVTEPVGKLGEVRYFYRREGRTIPKSVAFFLLRYLSGETSEHDHEIEDARWLDLRDALTTLTYEGEREMVARAIALLGDEDR